jgi:subtilisin family serine protease
MENAPDLTRDMLPAWGLAFGRQRSITPERLPGEITWEWAFADATGAGVRVCILDSGIEAGHPLVGTVSRSVTVAGEEEAPLVVDTDAEDVSGHGTACAGIIRSLAADVELASARVLGADVNGRFATLRAGLAWAVDEGYDILNLSLAVRSREFALDLAELADRAAFGGTLLVCSAHSLPVESYPWRFSSVVSVGSHDEDEPRRLYYNPEPPVEFYARGVDVPIAWPGGGTIRATGNSFAAPHVTGMLALIRSKHPQLTPFELKTVLYRVAANVRE